MTNQRKRKQRYHGTAQRGHGNTAAGCQCGGDGRAAMSPPRRLSPSSPPPPPASPGPASPPSRADSDPDPECFINAADGLPNVHPELALLHQTSRDDGDGDGDRDEILAELPRSLIVTGIPREVFEAADLKAELERLFRDGAGEGGGETAQFHWLKSFSRLRVYYETGATAARVRMLLHRLPFRDGVISCYFAQPVTPAGARSLEPPAPVKQFLISPPASPPVGWEPKAEHEPVVNEELLAALRALAPGEGHELVPSRGDQPAIVVHPDNQTRAEASRFQEEEASRE